MKQQVCKDHHKCEKCNWKHRDVWICEKCGYFMHYHHYSEGSIYTHYFNPSNKKHQTLGSKKEFLHLTKNNHIKSHNFM